MSDDKILLFPNVRDDIREDDIGSIEVSYTVDPEDMDAACFTIGATAIGLVSGANLPHEAVMHGALVVAAQAALSAGYSQEQFKFICSSIEFKDTPDPADVC
jgi:hypothetical protein|tara:strand:+ start:2525 stop:2830 length:306 start_codon:yes stop_codon:yes gene_type:complete